MKRTDDNYRGILFLNKHCNLTLVLKKKEPLSTKDIKRCFEEYKSKWMSGKSSSNMRQECFKTHIHVDHLEKPEDIDVLEVLCTSLTLSPVH